MILEIGAFRVMVCPSAGDPIGGGNVTDLIGDAIGQQADGVAVPVERLAAEFFRLATGSAGEIAQKAVNYGLHQLRRVRARSKSRPSSVVCHQPAGTARPRDGLAAPRTGSAYA
jgi:hypothetical protein